MIVMTAENENITFDTPSNYTYNSDIIVIENGEVKLKIEDDLLTTTNITFASASDFTYNSTYVQITGGIASLKESVEITDTEVFDDSDSWTYDSDKVEIVANAFQLKKPNETTGSGDFPFTTPSNYTLSDSTKIEIVNGESKLKLQVGTDGSFITTYTVDQNADFSLGSPTGILYGGATVTDGVLNLNGVNQRCDYDADLNADFFTGCVRVRVKPLYSGSPSSTQVFFTICKNHNDNSNGISLYHGTNGSLYIWTWNADGTVHAQAGISSWLQVAGQTYEFEVNFQTGGVLNVYLDGIRIYNRTIFDATRDTNINMLRIGQFGSAYSYTPQFQIVDMQIFSSVKHTSTSYTVNPPTFYLSAYVTSNNDIFNDPIDEFTTFVETVTKPIGSEIKYMLSADSGVTWLKVSGSSFITVTDATDYSEANTASEINAIFGNFPSITDTIRIRAFLNSDGNDSPELDNVEISWIEIDDVYTTGGAEMELTTPFQPTLIEEWRTAIANITEPTNTAIQFKYKTQNMGDYNATWLTISELETALQGLTMDNDGTDTLQIKVNLYTSDEDVTPSFTSATLGYLIQVDYYTGGQEVVMNTDIQPPALAYWRYITETVTEPTNTDVQYKYSTDSGVSWNSSWLTAAELQTALQSITGSQDGTDTLRFKFNLLTTDVEATPQIDNLKVDYLCFCILNNPIVTMNTDIQPNQVDEWLSVSTTETTPTGTSLSYQYSINGGNTYNGTWLEESDLVLGLQDISVNKDGTDKLRFKIQLHTDSLSATPVLSNMLISYLEFISPQSPIDSVRNLLGSIGTMDINFIQNERTTSLSTTTIVLRRKPIYMISGVYLATDTTKANNLYDSTSDVYNKYTGVLTLTTALSSANTNLVVDYSSYSGLSDAVIEDNMETAQIIIDNETGKTNNYVTDTTAKRCMIFLAGWLCLVTLSVPDMLQSGFNYRIGDLEVQKKIWGEGVISEALLNYFRQEVYNLLSQLGMQYPVDVTDIYSLNDYLDGEERYY